VLAAVVGAANAAAPAAAGVAPPPPYRAPYLPSSDSDVLQQVPAASDPAVRTMQMLRCTLDGNPASLVAAHELAQAYIAFGREVGDAHFVGYAEAVLAPWLAKPAPPAAALVDDATILQFRHEFTPARDRLKQALAADPNSAQAWLTLATLDMVQGNYATAAGDCAKVAATGGFALGIACTGNLRSYLGQAQQALNLLTQISGDAPGLSAPFKAWVQGLMAETAERLGIWSQVEEHYRQALKWTPKDNFLLVAYADFLLDRKRPEEVLTLLRDSSQSDTAFLRLALAKAALHSPELALYTWIMGARFEALTQRGSDYFGREQVRYTLYLRHDPQAALEVARRNWHIQRAPWDARVFLEAAQAANQPQAAAEVLQFLKDTKLEDPIIVPLAQQIEAQLKNRPAATP
jgi:tetratricopeptide (TPR) repeat protein